MISEILKALLGSPDLSATGTGGMQPTPTPAGPTGPVTKLDTEASSPQDLALMKLMLANPANRQAPQAAPTYDAKDQGRLGELMGEAVKPPPAAKQSTAKPDPGPVQAFLDRLFGPDTFPSIPEEGVVRPGGLNQAPKQPQYQSAPAHRYPDSAVASDPGGPLDQYFQAQARAAMGDPQAALMMQALEQANPKDIR